MTYQVIDGFVANGAGARVSEVRTVSESGSTAEVDSTVIGTGKKRTTPGANNDSLSLSMYYDPGDPQQGQIKRGATGLTLAWFLGGDTPGLRKRTYNDCACISSNILGTNHDGMVEYTAEIKINGDIVEEVIA